MVKHWRVFIPLLIVIVTLLYINRLQGQRDDAIAQYSDLITKNQLASDQRKAENAQKELEARLEQDIAIKKRQEALDALQVTKESLATLKKTIGEQYAKDQLNTARLDSAYERVRIESELRRTGLPDNAESAKHTEIRTELDATRARLGNLEQACAVTTVDFNSCASFVETVCNIYGCEK